MTASFVEVADEIAGAVHILSRHRIAAALLLDPSIPISGGVVVDAIVSRQLLVTIFAPESTIRGGVTVIRSGRIERAAVPLGWTDVVERAAELAAGVAIGVDEDTGGIRHVDVRGTVTPLSKEDLGGRLHTHALRTYAD